MVVTSLMFLILLGMAKCETICVKTVAATTVCPTSDKTVDAVNKLAEAIKTAGTIIYTDVDLSTSAFTDSNIVLISEINAIGTGTFAAKVTLGEGKTATSDSLTLSGITLTVDVATPAPPTVGRKLLADEKLTIKTLTLKSGSTITATNTAVTNLICDSITAATNPIAFTTDSLNLTTEDITKIAVGSDTTLATITTTSDLAIPKAIKKVEITGVVTKTEDLTFAGDFSTATDFAPAKFLVTLVYGNKGKSIVTFKADTTTAPIASTTPIIIVNTYSKFDADFTAALQKMVTLNPDFALGSDESRVSVPQSTEYCLYETGSADDKCPKDAQVLWSKDELKKVKFEKTLIKIYLSGYLATATKSLDLEFNDYKDKAVKFSSTERDMNQQVIKFNMDKKDETATGNLQFDNIQVTTVVPTGTTAATLKFDSLFVRKTEIKVEVAAPAPGASKYLKSGSADVPITLSADDLASDVDSYKALKFNTKETKPKKLAIIGVETATFAADGKSVTIAGTKLTDDIIPVPVTLAFIPGEKQEIDLTIEAATKGNPTALPFSIDVQPGVTLDAKYKGEWSGNKIVVNVPEGATFIGTTATGDGNSAPTMEAIGAGKAELDKKEIPRPAPPAGTPTSNGLGGGAIAGIVIACVVVVAAVVVVVVVVIKKKKSKVAN